MLSGAVLTWRKRRGHGQSASVKPNATSKAQRKAGEGRLEASSHQAPAKGAANPNKNVACTGTCHSISFSLGSELLRHIDFSLPGAFQSSGREPITRLDAYDQGSLGARWVTELSTRFDCREEGLVFLAPMAEATTTHSPRSDCFTMTL